MAKSGPPTLEDVALAAQVSTATISRSINMPEKVAKHTRERIQNAIDQLGYMPNFGGRVLASSRTNTIGAIIPSMSNAMFASGLQAFQEELSSAGVMMLVASTGYSTENEFRQIRSLLSHGADGLLLIGADRPQETTDFLTLRRIPYIVSWCYQNDPAQLFVGFDNVAAAAEMAQSVLEHGHRKIAMIAGVTRDNDRARGRVKGVSDAIAAHGQGARLLQTFEAPYTLAEGAAAFERLMELPERPSAIICGNDVLAAGAMMRARERGVRIPQEISITGFDDIGLASVVDPALTTVRVPQIEMGKTAARVLLSHLSGEGGAASVQIKTQIIHRASLARIGAPPG